ncbi:MAG TPA: universal stress protein [Candidatus Limnocylindrales bacterium]|nr:universal stress protein [Candidatus Limnocylindrales bacterium]
MTTMRVGQLSTVRDLDVELRTVRRILLATDLGQASEAATDEAIRLSARLGASLVVINILDPARLRDGDGRPDPRVDQARARRERAAQGIVARGRARGINARFLVWEGEAAEAIVAAAHAEAADLVVMGTHGRGPIGRLVFGSISERVVRDAAMRVLVVRPDGRGGLFPH